MNVQREKAAIILMLIIVLLGCLTNIKPILSDNTGGKIDLFTQKEPYSGKGLNTPSDAFAPGEVVILYALVTYNEKPLQRLIVTFRVQSPINETFSLSSKTNASGIATINFTIPQKCMNTSEVFGEWHALANVLINDEIFQDTLVFKVDWIIKLLSVRTIDENLTSRTYFGIEGDVGLEITLRNIAMTTRNATLAIVIQDELNVPINSLIINNFEAQPNGKILFLYCKLHIPKWAHIGNARAYVSALTAQINESGVAYCPAVSTDFFIIPYEPLNITYHDVAVVKASPSLKSVEKGQLVNISAVVRNEGTEKESFNVSAYCGDKFIGTLNVTELPPYTQTSLIFVLNTSLFDPGNYTITISIPRLMDEADVTDNTLVDGVVEVKAKPTPPLEVHDVAILDITPSAESLYIGETLNVNVTVKNNGTETESPKVSLYCDESLIQTLQILNIEPNAILTLNFVWNTTSVEEGLYRIKAYAEPVPYEVDVSNNLLVDGFVEVIAKPLHLIHDITVLDVTPSSNTVYVGEIVDITVTVKNGGDFTESFNVTLYCNSTAVSKLLLNDLAAGKTNTLVFHWDTHGVKLGRYILKATAEAVLGEENVENNSFEDGVVEVVAAPAGWFPPQWLWWLLLLLLILLIVLLAVLLYRRKKRKKTQEAFQKGWTAWYYGYDLRGKEHKSFK